MAEIGSGAERNARTTSNTNFGKDTSNIRLGQGNHEGGSSNFAHSRNDKVGVDVFNDDSITSEFGTKSLRPSGEESFASRVDREIGSGNKTRK